MPTQPKPGQLHERPDYSDGNALQTFKFGGLILLGIAGIAALLIGLLSLFV